MTILTLATEAPGFNDLKPRIGHMECNDLLDTITTAGYINNSPASSGINFSNGDIIAVKYSDGSGGTTSGWFQVTIPANSNIITLSDSELDVPLYVQGITPGVSAPEKAIVLDNENSIDSASWSSILNAGNYYSNLTATAAEANLNHLQVASVTTVSTAPASGTCAVQFALKDAAGSAIAAVTPIMFYTSDVSGALAAAVTSYAALTHGATQTLVTGQIQFATTDSGGLLGLTVTNTAGTTYVTFVLPNGKTAVSSAIVVNA